VRVAAEALRDEYIFSWKPKPAELLLSDYQTVVRQSIADTLGAARDGVVEMIMKDTHTCNREPERLANWVRVAREMVGAGAVS
jgi:hypothetical protein